MISIDIMCQNMSIPETTISHYLTGKAALNIPDESGSGDWHFSQFFQGYAGHAPGPFPIAGQDMMSTNSVLGDIGIEDRAPVLQRHRATACPEHVYAASHARAYVDLLIDTASRGLKFSSAFEYDQWFTDREAKALLPMLEHAARLLDEQTRSTLLVWFVKQLP